MLISKNMCAVYHCISFFCKIFKEGYSPVHLISYGSLLKSFNDNCLHTVYTKFCVGSSKPIENLCRARGRRTDLGP